MRRQHAVAWLVAIVAVFLAVALVPGCGGGAPAYRLTVTFNASVTQADMDEVSRLLRDVDPGAEMLITETFPPIGHVTLKTDIPDFCDKIETELGRLSFVQSVTCERLDGGSYGGG